MAYLTVDGKRRVYIPTAGTPPLSRSATPTWRRCGAFWTNFSPLRPSPIHPEKASPEARHER